MRAALASATDWVLDRSVVGGYTKVGYDLRGLAGAPLDPEGRLAGARVVITGASSGIGAATAESFAALGAEVHIVVRDAGRGAEVIDGIAARTGSDRLRVWTCDLAELDSVRSLGAELGAELETIDALVHNAGALYQERRRTSDGHELTFALHVLGPFLLTELLRDRLSAAADGRVVFVTSGGMYTARLDLDDLELDERAFDGPRFYAHAKRAQVALVGELQRRFGGDLSFHAMHPGWVATPGVEGSLPRFHALTKPLLRDAEQGADTIVWLAAAREPRDDPGRLWMDRRRRPEHRVPWTRERNGEAERLYVRCAEAAGIDPAATGDPGDPRLEQARVG